MHLNTAHACAACMPSTNLKQCKLLVNASAVSGQCDMRNHGLPAPSRKHNASGAYTGGGNMKVRLTMHVPSSSPPPVLNASSSRFTSCALTPLVSRPLFFSSSLSSVTFSFDGVISLSDMFVTGTIATRQSAFKSAAIHQDESIDSIV